MRYVSAREANQHFSKLLGEAVEGEEVVITRRGTPVAVLKRIEAPLIDPARAAAVERAIEFMRSGPFAGSGQRFTRDEMHER